MVGDSPQANGAVNNFGQLIEKDRGIRDAIVLKLQPSKHRCQVVRMAVRPNPSEYRLQPDLGLILFDYMRISFEFKGLINLAGTLTHLV